MKLVLVRHGESIWNKENKFTGWTDVDLSENGIKEAKEAGYALSKSNIKFDEAYTSLLLRAQKTLDIIKCELKEEIPTIKTWRLNERFYGALQGLNKEESKKVYGEEQVKLWRRSSNVRPPEVAEDDERFPGNDPKYKDIDKSLLPKTENLNDNIIRVEEIYNEIINKIKNNKNILVVAHGNSIRAIIKILKNLNEEDLMKLEIETGNPYIIDLDKDINIIEEKYLLERNK